MHVWRRKRTRLEQVNELLPQMMKTFSQEPMFMMHDQLSKRAIADTEIQLSVAPEGDTHDMSLQSRSSQQGNTTVLCCNMVNWLGTRQPSDLSIEKLDSTQN